MRKFERTGYGRIPNPESEPGKCGLRIVSYVGDGGYDWEVDIVFQDIETGHLFHYHGSGCSCYGPCEGFEGLDDFTPIGRFSDLESVAKKPYAISDKQWFDHLKKVREVLDRKHDNLFKTDLGGK